MALCRAGWRVVYEERRASPGPRRPPRCAAVAAAVPLVLRHDAGDVEAPRRGGRSAGRPAGSAAAVCATSLLFQVLLPLFAPIVDVFALYGLSSSTRCRSSARLARLPRCADSLDRRLRAAAGRGALRPLWALPLQQFVYRQLMYLVVIQSVVTALAGVRLRWHRMERYGSLRVPPASQGQRSHGHRHGVDTHPSALAPAPAGGFFPTPTWESHRRIAPIARASTRTRLATNSRTLPSPARPPPAGRRTPSVPLRRRPRGCR